MLWAYDVPVTADAESVSGDAGPVECLVRHGRVDALADDSSGVGRPFFRLPPVGQESEHHLSNRESARLVEHANVLVFAEKRPKTSPLVVACHYDDGHLPRRLPEPSRCIGDRFLARLRAVEEVTRVYDRVNLSFQRRPKSPPEGYRVVLSTAETVWDAPWLEHAAQMGVGEMKNTQGELAPLL